MVLEVAPAGDRSVFVSGSAVNAAEEGRRWKLALGLLAEMRCLRVEPSVISFNSAISALEKCAEWQMALASLQRLVHHGLEPTDVTFGAALSSCEKGLQWQRVLRFLDHMQSFRLAWASQHGASWENSQKRFGITSRFDGSVMKCTALRAASAVGSGSRHGIAARSFWPAVFSEYMLLLLVFCLVSICLTASRPRSRSSEVWMLDVSAQSEPGGPEFRKLGWSGDGCREPLPLRNHRSDQMWQLLLVSCGRLIVCRAIFYKSTTFLVREIRTVAAVSWRNANSWGPSSWSGLLSAVRLHVFGRLHASQFQRGPVPWPLLVHCIDVCIPCLCCQAEGSGPPVSSMSSRKADQMFAPRMPDEGLDIPDHLGSDVTFDQKKRLARLAKMGIGPVAGAGGRAPSSSGSNASRGGGALALTDQRSVDGRGDASAAGLTDEERQGRLAERRFAMIEQERRLRMQEEQKRQQEEDDAKDRFRKSTRNRAGLVSLGAVQARPESLGRFPTPASAPVASVFESGPPMQKKGKMEVKISARTVESVAAARVVEAPAALPKVKESRSSDGDDKQESARRFQESVPRSAAPPAAAAAAPEPEDSEDDEPPASPVRAAPAAPGLSAEAQVLAELRAQRRQAEAREARRQAEAEGKKKGKKRKKTKKKDDSECEGSEEDMASEDSGEQESRDRLATVQARKQSRDGGISWKVMEGAGQSVKGMVSSDNKRMTDAELERRFAAQDNQSGSHGLMSEEQVKKMLQKEKISKGDVNSSWRAQKELEEWTKMKEQKMSRAGNDKERLVVSRK
ncbi:unnamed protein product [Polarella glacialis]|uniref:Uncharacterized protein n=1 Tax=Polarella glacialis TaxID=89957 RepID=A0A813FZV6_POLGL|nr:unnamed protein product [Polarella glacialis]